VQPGSNPRPGRRYVLITPARDEARYAERTLRTVSEQSEPPALWVIVDDGSSDRTPEILRDWQQKLPYLKVVRREDRGHRKVGPGVVDAFYAGLERVDLSHFEYLCKLDLDLELPEGYFAGVMDRMAADPRMGTFSGKPYFIHQGLLGGSRISEMCGDENAVGMAKFYRVQAFREIGGFVREIMWDGIDGHMCRRLGWRAASEDVPALQFEHLRPMGTSHKGWWTGRARHGRGQHFMGTGPLYMIASALYRMSRPPIVIGGVAMLWGYFSAWLRREPRYDQRENDPGFRVFLRRYQSMSLLRGKLRATTLTDAEQAAVFAKRRESERVETGA
jgi:glycosyltransferase involved in cell wall biosynthesis